MIRRPPRSPLFPSTPLSRSGGADLVDERGGVSLLHGVLHAAVGVGRLVYEERAEEEGRQDRQHRHREHERERGDGAGDPAVDRKSTRLNSSHGYISYAVFCL